MLTAPPALRQLVLAVAVLHDVDLQPADEALTVTTARAAIDVGWQEVERIAGGGELTERISRLAGWLQARVALEGGAQLHVLGLTADDRPDPDWVRERVPGGAVLLGLGYDNGASPGCQPLPSGVLAHAGIDTDIAWRSVRDELETIGALAARLDRRRHRAALRPVGGADVVTLLGSAAYRAEIAGGEGDRLAVLVVPLRVRGWRATAVSDPVFAPALAAAMSPAERGFSRPLLVSAHEVDEVAEDRRRLAAG